MIILDSLELRKTSRRPVWIMRQAGRYLKSYQDMRKKYSFDDFASNADLATEVSLLPMNQYPLDASVVFSDILIPLKDFGLKVEFLEGGPVISKPSNLKELPERIRKFDPARATPTIMQTIKNVRGSLDKEKAVLGFCGAPFTMLTYLVEGRLSKDLGQVKSLMATEPGLTKEILSALAEAMGTYLEAQVEAGANAVQLFDTWASQLSGEEFEEFALPYAREVVAAVTSPTIYYVNGVSHLLSSLGSVGAQCLSVDWRMPLGEIRKSISQVVALQGNLDPYHLLLSPDRLRQKVFEMCSSYGDAPGHIVNLGHGIVPGIPEDQVKRFIDYVHEWSSQNLAGV